jgi:O-methyltransferase
MKSARTSWARYIANGASRRARARLRPFMQAISDMRFRCLYRKFRPFTMVPPESYIDNMRLAERVRKAKLQGCVLECGVWRGGMIAGLATLLGSERDYFLFDSFEGLPSAKQVDGESALRWQASTDAPGYFDNCCAPPEFASKAMKIAGARSFSLVKGWFNETVPNFKPPSPIALLRLDGDWYESTIVCLVHLFDEVAPGGIVILDDYYTWDGCSRALHDFLSKRSAVERVRSLGNVCFLEKR